MILIWCVYRKPALLMTVKKSLERNIFVEKKAVTGTIHLRLHKAKQIDPNVNREGRGVLLVKRLGSNTFAEKRAVMVTIPLRLPKAKQMDSNMEREREVLLMKRLGKRKGK